ncbi:MAG: SDR family oxidoreductase [Simkaniaceae bacterium]
MDLGLKNKRVFVMASSTGIGFAIAKTFAEEGAAVAICSSQEEKIKKAAEQIPNAVALIGDFNQEGSSKELTREAIQKLGGLDVLVTNAGGPPKGSFMDLSNDAWKQGFQGLWLAATEAIFEAAKAMKQQKYGRILLSTSTAAKQPIDHLTISNALRAGLLGLMKTLSKEFASHGITVNALLPGFIQTERLKKFPIPENELLKQIPAGRLGHPEEMAALAAFLGSDKAAYITGQAIACDGGLLKGI